MAGADGAAEPAGATGDIVVPPASTVSSTETEVILAAGDIAECTTDSGDEATAEILGQHPEATILTLGDNAYPEGRAEAFAKCYDPTWGKYKDRTRPATGNHDFGVKDAAAYADYFGEAGGPFDQYYYSYDLGAWHVVVLNSDCWRAGGCGLADPQVQWLYSDLTRHPARCTLAYFHRPPFSSGRYGDPAATDRVRPIWEVLYEGGADVVLTGHEHSYERFVPMNSRGESEAGGLQLFVVGTGGGNLRKYDNPPLPTTAIRQDHAWGVLEITLRPDGYDWEFLPVKDANFHDSGSGTCR